MSPILSICIPTYQRRERVARLVRTILEIDAPLEVCVHIDGSADGTAEDLATLAGSDRRLRVSQAPNQGRAKCLEVLFNACTGRFVMFYDDDDEIYPDILRQAVVRLQQDLPAGVCGYVFEMSIGGRPTEGAPLPPRSNFLRLRADQGVTGDKKEIVLRELLTPNFYRARAADRRVPTSTLWTKLALKYDVLGDNRPIGGKHYLEGGYTDRVQALKVQNPGPMARVSAYRCVGFLLGRYRSIPYFLRSVAALLVYSARLAVFQVAGPRTKAPPHAAPVA